MPCPVPPDGTRTRGSILRRSGKGGCAPGDDGGNAGKGLTSSLRDGIGKWVLDIIGEFADMQAVHFIRNQDGGLTNMSNAVETQALQQAENVDNFD